MRIKKYFICFFVALILCFISAVLCNYSADGYDILKNASYVPIFESGEIKEGGVYVDEKIFPTTF